MADLPRFNCQDCITAQYLGNTKLFSNEFRFIPQLGKKIFTILLIMRKREFSQLIFL